MSRATTKSKPMSCIIMKRRPPHSTSAPSLIERPLTGAHHHPSPSIQRTPSRILFAVSHGPSSASRSASLTSATFSATPMRSPASCARRLLVVKSLLSFAARMGFTPFNIGAAIRPPPPDDRLAERILDERQVFALLDAVEAHPRDHALIIRLLY